jgi:hypothetical protein|uniref:Replication protein n=1 Tax=Siphoviridae sp. ctGDt6 TaxID=2825408 RepID=A0A8S5U856_9CAUD|nr:MAG TPA: hypothetical protein [Siphoviridae sp. ctGDt6]
MNFNELFVDKSKTLIINTDLALVLGDLNEAIVLNQLNYWLGINKKAGKNFIDDRYWVYNSYSDWKAKDFPYWSEKTIQRTFTRLENKGVVLSANYNKLAIDKTKWYTIDTEKLQELVDKFNSDEDKMTNRQDNMTDRQDKMTCREGQNDRPLPEINTENIDRDYTTEIKYALSESKDSSRGDIYAFSAEKGGSKSDVIKNLAVEFADCEPSDWRIEELKHIIDYFLEQYSKTQNMSHIRITEQALTKIVINYFEPVGNYMSDNSAYGFDDYYKELIDYYLQTKYKINGKEVTKSLQHFMSGMIRENLAQKYLK